MPAPVFIMGVVATVAGGLAVLFPETLGETLPESAEEAARWGTRHHWSGLLVVCCSIGSRSKRGLCTFTCFNIREHYGEELRGVANMGIAGEELRLSR